MEPFGLMKGKNCGWIIDEWDEFIKSIYWIIKVPGSSPNVHLYNIKYLIFTLYIGNNKYFDFICLRREEWDMVVSLKPEQVLTLGVGLLLRRENETWL